MSPDIKVSGFTLIRNGSSFDYPFLESIRSLLPLVEELIINVGIGSDDTLDRIKELVANEPMGRKIQWFESHWPLNDPEKKREGKILSEQTNLALNRCKNDWCFYLQADEVLHEVDLPIIREWVARADSHSETDGLLFDYVHFYGSFDVIQKSRSAYRREVRLIRKSSGAKSVGDAQSFRLPDGSKPRVLYTMARIFHYGWVRTPEAMKEKTFFMDQLYHGDPSQEQSLEKRPHTGQNYLYKRFWGLKPFRGSHPQVMADRIAKKGWHWNLKDAPFQWSWKDLKKIASDVIENITGCRLFEYRSYRRIR